VTQAERVLAILRDAGSRGVCSLTFYRSGLPHSRNIVATELRHRGFVIDRAPCAEDDHGRAPYFRYVLAHDPERAPVQQRMAL
jgi:hypothetical protein